jgi:hypothetical protein
VAGTAMALYYPWMHFQDEAWLKTALLTWENLVRVRPRDFEDRDSEMVRRLRGESDLLAEIVPTARDLALVGDAFTDVISEYREKVAGTWRVTGRDSLSPPDQAFASPASNAYVPGSTLTWVYCGPGGARMGSDLRIRLLDLGVAVAGEETESWVGMRPKLASIYMAALADAVAGHDRLAPATDDPRMHSALGALDRLAGLLLDEPDTLAAPDRREDLAGAYVHLALESVLQPRNPAAVPVDKLIAFRARHKAELQVFWTHVSGLADELASIAEVDNPQVAQLHMQSLYERQTKPLLADLRAGLRAADVDTVAGAMALKVNLTAASGTALGAAAMAAGGQPILGAASVALTVIPYFISRLRGQRARRAASPVAYLLAANRELSGRHLLQSLH